MIRSKMGCFELHAVRGGHRVSASPSNPSNWSPDSMRSSDESSTASAVPDRTFDGPMGVVPGERPQRSSGASLEDSHTRIGEQRVLHLREGGADEGQRALAVSACTSSPVRSRVGASASVMLPMHHAWYATTSTLCGRVTTRTLAVPTVPAWRAWWRNHGVCSSDRHTNWSISWFGSSSRGGRYCPVTS